RALVCFNNLHVKQELAKIPKDAKEVYLHLTRVVTLIDHTSCENLLHFREDLNKQGDTRVEILGIDTMSMRSGYPSCMRLGVPLTADVPVNDLRPVAVAAK